MKVRTIFCLMAVSLGAFAAEVKIQEPPERFSRATIEGWLQQAVARIRPNLKLRVLSSPEAHQYFNFEHFVPRDSDPHGGQAVLEGQKLYDYSWDEKTAAERGVPTGEVTETGEYLIWWNRCNFKGYTETVCKAFIDLITRHEARHFDQWKAVALEAMSSTGLILRDEASILKLPLSLGDIPEFKVKEAIKVRWSDVAHYQCREVEVYSTQISNGEMEPFHLKERIPYLEWYTTKCKNSKWAEEFSKAIHLSEAISNWWKTSQNK